MNNGKFLKKIFTIGDASVRAAEAFFKNWEYGWIEHIMLADLQSYSRSSVESHNFFSIFVVDSDIVSLNKMKILIKKLLNRNDFQIIVLTEKTMGFEQLAAMKAIDDMLGKSKLKVADYASIDSILECYAHLLCGSSYCCLDFNDISVWLYAGTTFCSKGIQIDEAVQNELPYRIFTQLSELKAACERQGHKIAALNLVFLGKNMTQALFEASLCMVSGFYQFPLELSVHSNIDESTQNRGIGARLFASLNTKPHAGIAVKDIPEFLKK